MLSKLVALSSVSMALAATGSRTALCTALLDNTGCGNATATQFPDPQTTVAECEQLFAIAVTEDGDDTNTTGNTIGCRQYWAAQAKATNALWKCKFAGFTGGGVCQDAAPAGVLKAACNVIDAACTGNPYYPYGNSSDCAGVLNPMAAVWGSNQGNRAAAENSLECRVYHALVGWNRTTGQEIHCGHVTLASNATFCGGGVTTHPEHYCTTVMSSTCGSPATQYGSMDICLNTFKTFPDANATSTEANNTRGCRQYHAQAAVSLQDASHCYHGGPSGGGVCGGAAGGRVAWQILTNNSNCQGNNSWVAMSVGLAFAAWAPADLLAVVPGGDPTVYNTTVYSSTNNDLCRLYHLTVATTAVDHCSHGSISGAGQCGNVTTITCALINQGCPSNYANAEACAADIMPLFAKPGDPSQMMMAPTDDSLQCRVYYAGLALVGKAMSNTTTTAAACASAKNNGSMACVGAAPTDAAAPSTSGVAPVAASLMVLIPALLL